MVTPSPRPPSATVSSARSSPSATPPPSPGCSIPAALRGKDLEVVPGGAQVVALTFDAGANADAVASILATLAAEKVPATFFLTGRFVTDFPAESRRIASRYPVGNHTQSHPDLTTLSRTRVVAEIRTGAANITRITGVDPRPYFRFPLGAVNGSVIDLVNRECYVPFRWTIDTVGWRGTSGGMSVAKVHQRVIQGLRPGAIVLMHVGSHPTDRSTLDADALPGMIAELRQRGYRFVTLESVLPAAP
jgi:peptidoglycan/xylan/chitin deacetylase (PgdA/CDA1 family)